MDIQWYPGHMAKTRRMMAENIALVDIVIELLDARIPMASKNPDIDTLAKDKKRIVVMNKADLADEEMNKRWRIFFEGQGHSVILADATKGTGLNEITKAAEHLMKEKKERLKARGRIFVPTRAMIAGIPNVGKSTLINRYAGRAITKTADKPGVTKSKQWVKIKKDFELLDTPGILWPKFDDQQVGIKLAVTGAINDTILDIYTLALHLLELIGEMKPEALWARYKLEAVPGESPAELLGRIADVRAYVQKGGVRDLERTAIILLDEFRGGKIGKISLEKPAQP